MMEAVKMFLKYWQVFFDMFGFLLSDLGKVVLFVSTASFPYILVISLMRKIKAWYWLKISFSSMVLILTTIPLIGFLYILKTLLPFEVSAADFALFIGGSLFFLDLSLPLLCFYR